MSLVIKEKKKICVFSGLSFSGVAHTTKKIKNKKNQAKTKQTKN